MAATDNIIKLDAAGHVRLAAASGCVSARKQAARRRKDAPRYRLNYLQRAFNKGRDAYRAGKPLEPNPYRNGCINAASAYREGFVRTEIGDGWLARDNSHNIAPVRTKEAK